MIAPPEYVWVNTEIQTNFKVYSDLFERHTVDTPFEIIDSELLDLSVHLSASNFLASLALTLRKSSSVSTLRRVRFTGLLVSRGYASK